MVYRLPSKVVHPLTFTIHVGRTYFINEYVTKRAIPIPKLLYAFSICLVRVMTLLEHHLSLGISANMFGQPCSVQTTSRETSQNPFILSRGSSDPRVRRLFRIFSERKLTTHSISSAGWKLAKSFLNTILSTTPWT